MIPASPDPTASPAPDVPARADDPTDAPKATARKRSRKPAGAALEATGDFQAPTSYVCLGASAGGLEPLKAFFGAMPATSELAFGVIQHMAANAVSMLPEILANVTVMPVETAVHGTELAANHVYVVPPNCTPSFESGRFALGPREPGPQPFLVIDHRFKSLATDQGEKAIGIILSGAASDGASGLSGGRRAGAGPGHRAI